MPQIKTFCRIKPTEEYYPEFELSTAVLHLRVPELLRDIGSPNKNQRNIVSHEFNFDYIFNSDTTQEQVFDVAAKEIVEGFLNGYNGTIFAYGQTGTGKTFTVEGSPKQYKHRGLEPRALSMIYKALEQRPDEDISVHLSYLEIYKEVGYDLLNPGARTTSLVTPFPKVSVLEGQQGIWVVRNLSVHYAASEEVAQNLLIQGQANRRVAATTVHDRSSRSHAVFTIQLSSKKPGSDIIVKSKLHLVDLAGSERVSKTGAEGHLLNEAKCINLSLHYLETVIVSLQASVSQSSRQRQHSAGHYRGYSSSLKQRPSSADGHRNIRYVPYRNSLLTMVLRDSLGGNCLTAMIATISLEPENLGESISTCRFAGRVACIANSVSRNEEVDEKSLIRKLRRRVAELESELHCLRFGKENIDAMNAKMTDEDKLYCSEIMHKYVDGEIKDPLTEGITSPYKFRESLRVLKKMVLEGYFNKNNNDDVNVLELESKNYPRSPERQTFKSERRSNHRSPERKKQRNNQNGLTTSGDDNTSEINVQVNKRQQQEKTVEFPINAWEPAEPEVKPAPKPKKIKPKVLDENKLQDEPISKPVTLEDRDGNDDNKKKESLSNLLKKTPPNKYNKTPFEQKRIKEIKKLNVKVEQLQKEQKDKEGEMMEMKLALAEEELEMMEQHVKTKLNVTKDQVEDQHAYIQQLKTTEADSKLIEQEKLVEKQLLKRQLKFQKKLDHIDDRKQQLRQQSATVKSENQDKTTLEDQFGKFRKKDGSLNTRQVFQMLKTEEKKHEKMQSQIDQEKLFLVNKHLELREAATRQKLQEFKEMLRLSKTAGLPYDTYNGEAFPNNDRAVFLKSAPAHYKEGQMKNNTDHDDRFSSAHTRYTQSTRLTTSDSNHDNTSVYTRLPTSHSDRLLTSQTDQDNMSTVTKSTRLQTSHSNRHTNSEDFDADDVNDIYESRQSTSISNRPSSAKSNRSVGSIIPDPEFYAKKKEEKDPTVKWEAAFSRNSTSSSNRQIDKNLELATDDAKSTALKSSAGVRRVEFTVESDPEPDPEPVETLMPSEYVYGMRSGDQFDARKMGLGSKSFDSALSSMLEKENVNYYVSDKDYDRYARTSKPSTRSTNRSKSRERSKSRDRSIERTYVPITVYNGWDFKESSSSRDRQRSIERVKERPREPEKKTYRKEPSYSEERGRSKERKPPPQRYRNWGPEAKHYAVSDRLTTLDIKTPETKSRKSNRYDFQSKDDSNINDYLNKKPVHENLNSSLQIEETRSPRVTAIPEEEAEQTFMSKVKEQKNRVDKIRKARAAATVIQRAWRRYHARTKYRR